MSNNGSLVIAESCRWENMKGSPTRSRSLRSQSDAAINKEVSLGMSKHGEEARRLFLLTETFISNASNSLQLPLITSNTKEEKQKFTWKWGLTLRAQPASPCVRFISVSGSPLFSPEDAEWICVKSDGLI
ncbi:hypothetical protein EYF80_021209 [Liparis tanakae]|uniref:Uncharacterized protein n=1 Tax=Liparis tanakae TaxID=230148 RepID=A0A4Z2HUD0_9TELE|nr:hypothetical protein EYF80_021209 [Liparis tanakae]